MKASYLLFARVCNVIDKINRIFLLGATAGKTNYPWVLGLYSTTKHRNANAIFLVKLIWRLVGQDSDFQVSSTNTKTTMLGSQKIPQYLPQLVIW